MAVRLDTARLQELAGVAPFRFEEWVDARGRVHRYAHGKIGPFPVNWEEDFGEWQENCPLFPSSRVPERSDAALGVELRATCRRRELSVGHDRHGRDDLRIEN